MTDYLSLAERLELANGFDSTARLLSNSKEAAAALREAHAEINSWRANARDSGVEARTYKAEVERLRALTRQLYLSSLAGWAREDLMYLPEEERNKRIDAELKGIK